jgi:hypothetical protein
MRPECVVRATFGESSDRAVVDASGGGESVPHAWLMMAKEGSSMQHATAKGGPVESASAEGWEQVVVERALGEFFIPWARLAAVAGCFLACTPFKDDAPRPVADSSDASAPSTPSSCDLTAPFDAPTFVPFVDPGLPAESPTCLRLSADGLTAYFSANGATNPYSDLFVATRASLGEPFGEQTDMESLNSPYFDGCPTPAPDGLTLLFHNSSPDQGPVQILYGTRTALSDSFVNVGPVANVNIGSQNLAPYLRADGQVLYLASNWASASVFDASADKDIFRSTLSGTTFGTPIRVTELSSTSEDSDPVVTPDDLTIYFMSARPTDGTANHMHIWTAQRPGAGEPFLPPVLVSELAAFGTDQRPTFISADGCTLYLSATVGSPTSMVYLAQKPSR